MLFVPDGVSSVLTFSLGEPRRFSTAGELDKSAGISFAKLSSVLSAPFTNKQ